MIDDLRFYSRKIRQALMELGTECNFANGLVKALDCNMHHIMCMPRYNPALPLQKKEFISWNFMTPNLPDR